MTIHKRALATGALGLLACAALDAPEVRERMAAPTVTPGVRPVEERPSYAAAETGKWRDLVKVRNIRLQ